MNKTLFAISEYLKERWQRIVAGIVADAVLIAIVFSFPLITITNETMQTEYAIEIRQESYLETEPYTTIELVEKDKVITSGYHKVIPSGIFIPFSVDEAGSTLVGLVENSIPGGFTVLTDINRIFWETWGTKAVINLPLPPGIYRARFREDVMWGEDCYLYLTIKWTVAELTTRYQEVLKYREVPVRVEKQKTVVTEDQISVWQYLFVGANL